MFIELTDHWTDGKISLDPKVISLVKYRTDINATHIQFTVGGQLDVVNVKEPYSEVMKLIGEAIQQDELLSSHSRLQQRAAYRQDAESASSGTVERPQS